MELKIPAGTLTFDGRTLVIRKLDSEKRIPAASITAVQHQPPQFMSSFGYVAFSIAGEEASSRRTRMPSIREDQKLENSTLYLKKQRTQIEALIAAVEAARG